MIGKPSTRHGKHDTYQNVEVAPTSGLEGLAKLGEQPYDASPRLQSASLTSPPAAAKIGWQDLGPPP